MKYKRVLAGLLVLIICLTGVTYMNTTKSQAASASITIALSSSSIKKGDSVSVTVKVSCSGAIGAVSYCLSYNSSILEYSSGSGSGGGGTVMYAGYGDGSATSLSATFTFKAISTGTASLSTGSAEVYAWDESYCSVSNAGCNVTVSAADGGNNNTTENSTTEKATTEKPASEATTENESSENASSEAQTEETTEEEYSDNCYLKSLEITPGTFTPAFSKDQYTYEALVPADTESLAINAIPEDDTALVSIDGNSDFIAGQINKVTITVTAETGNQKIYYLNVSSEEIVDTRVFVTLNGIEYYFAEDYNGLMIPEGFSQTTGTYQGNDIIMFTSPNGAVNCVCLTNDDGDENWFIYDISTESFTPFIEATASYNRYLILTPSSDIAIPDGYNEFSYTFDGKDITAYHQNEADEIILIYAMNVEGEAGFYRYDTVENTFLRYISDTQITIADTATPADASKDEGFLDKYKNLIAVIAIIVSVIMLIIIISLSVVLAKVTKKYSNNSENDNNEDITDDVASGIDETTAISNNNEQADSNEIDEAVESEHIPGSAEVDELIDSAFSGIQFTPHISKNSKPRITAVPVQNEAPDNTDYDGPSDIQTDTLDTEPNMVSSNITDTGIDEEQQNGLNPDDSTPTE